MNRNVGSTNEFCVQKTVKMHFENFKVRFCLFKLLISISFHINEGVTLFFYFINIKPI